MPFTISGQVTGELKEKRLKLPGIIVKDECPKCGIGFEWDGKFDYLHYPVPNTAIPFQMYCYNCDYEWTHDVQLTIKLEKVSKPKNVSKTSTASKK